MFISKFEKQQMQNRIAKLEETLAKLMQDAPWGRKKDATPRAKPGRKTTAQGAQK